VSVVSLTLALLLVTEPAWPARRPPVAPVAGHELRDPFRWPPEPPSPPSEDIDADRFSDAVGALCRRPSQRRLGPMILTAAVEAGVDPFILAALVFHQSGCDRALWTPAGYGLLGLHPGMYFRPGHPPEPVTRAELEPDRLRDAAHSLRAGARLLAMWEQRHAEIDARFRGARHRAAVSHFVWGDVVGSSAAEDQILTARRRLLERYGGPPAPRASSLGIDLVSPLEGAPRVATSGMGEARDGGARRHRGLDIAGAVGEPVRSIADGVVVFAGLDLPGSSSHEVLSPRDSARWSSSSATGEAGPGGLFVCIDHDAHRSHDPHEARGTVTSCYFHLRRYFVRSEERVVAGQMVGEIGVSGVRTSLPHLHFEVHVADRALNPLPILGDLVIPPRETVAHGSAIRRQRVRLAGNGASPPAPADGIVSARQHGRAARGPVRDAGDARSRSSGSRI
jgi:hypothetical protein